MSSSENHGKPGRTQLGVARRNREIKLRNLASPAVPKPHSASPLRSIHLYEKDAETNLLNFVDFLSGVDVVVEREISFTAAEQIGIGSTMEVFSVAWKLNEPRVAVKRMRRDTIPRRSANLPLEKDTAYVKAVKLFHHDVKSIMQEILVMSREPLSTHQNIVRLLAVSWDNEEDYLINHLFPPLMVVELAHRNTPTLAAYYAKHSGDHPHVANIGFIADVADGLSALHMCGVIHGDLKPENVLLFDDPQNDTSLIAKLSDFGFANIDLLKEPVRGSSEYWSAPERIDGCPQSIKSEVEYIEMAEKSSDVYSFGLVTAFIALNGTYPLTSSTAAVEVSEARERTQDQEAINNVKFSDGVRFEIAEKLQTYYSKNHPGYARQALCQTYISLIHDTLGSIPSKRISSLAVVRQRISGKDPFARQRKLDRFKVRPFNDSFRSFSTLQNLFSNRKYSFSAHVLESLPNRVKNELLEIVGKNPELGETQLHGLRRARLQEVYEGVGKKAEQNEIDYENIKVDVNGLTRVLGSLNDIFDLSAFVGSQLQTSLHAEMEFLELESQFRPELFTLIDGNNTRKARKLLRANPSLAKEVLPELGWTPLHLAACEGRTKIIKMLVFEFGVNPDIRCNTSQRCTPLHQAVTGKQAKAAKLLLRLGSNVDAKLKVEGNVYMTPLEVVMQHCLTKNEPSKEDMEIVRVLLKGGADYLRAGSNGCPIIFTAVKYLKLIKHFFDCIGPEDSRLAVNFRDSDKETMLHGAVMRAEFDIVKLLLDYGADAGARDISGHTPYVKLLSGIGLRGTIHFAPLEAMKFLGAKTAPDHENANKVLKLLEQQGADATALDDEAFTKEEVERIQSNFRAYPRIGKIYNPKQIANAERQVIRYFNSDSPYLKKLTSIRSEYTLLALAQSLANWADDREEGLISSTELPRQWSEFFEEANTQMEGLLTSWMEPDQIPQITRLIKDKTISICQRIVEKNGIEILVQLNRLVQETTATGAMDDIVEHVTSLITILPKVYGEFERSHISWTTKIFALQRLKQIWRAVNKGETLDLLYELAAMINMDDNLDLMDNYTIFQPLRSGARTPASVLETASLPERYQKATVFITSRILLPSRRIGVLLFFLQLLIFLLPCIILYISARITWWSMKCGSSKAFIWMYLWPKFIPSSWWLFNASYQFHPNVYRGLQAAWELVLFRLRHWFPHEEPLILSFDSTASNEIGILSRLESVRKTTLFPIYGLSCRSDNLGPPVPCYGAMREVMTKWSDGRLPRKAWGDGGWELIGGEKKEWKRVDVIEHPTWGQYSKASKQIKETLLAKNRRDLYLQFLEIRDYYLEPPAQQLEAMDNLFGAEHAECTSIWKAVFIDNTDPIAMPRMNKKKLGWLERLVVEMGIDRIRDLIPYTWDLGLLDQNGAPVLKGEAAEAVGREALEALLQTFR